jgi:di- and tripeptidase
MRVTDRDRVDSTVIPSTVKAQVSVRIVPDQDLDTVAKSLCDHLEASFSELNSPNKLKANSLPN